MQSVWISFSLPGSSFFRYFFINLLCQHRSQAWCHLKALYLIFIFQNLPVTSNCSSRSVIRRIIGFRLFDTFFKNLLKNSSIFPVFAVIYPFCISAVKNHRHTSMTKPYTEKDQIFSPAPESYCNNTRYYNHNYNCRVGSTHRRQTRL